MLTVTQLREQTENHPAMHPAGLAFMACGLDTHKAVRERKMEMKECALCGPICLLP